MAAEGFVFGADADKRSRLDMRMAQSTTSVGKSKSTSEHGSVGNVRGGDGATPAASRAVGANACAAGEQSFIDLFVTCIDNHTFHDMLLVSLLLKPRVYAALRMIAWCT